MCVGTLISMLLTRASAGLLALTALVPALPAEAACDADNLYSFSFASQAAATLSYTGSYNYTASNPLGATRSFTMRFATNGLSSSTIAGRQMPAISTLINDGSGNSLVVGGVFSGRTSNIFSNARVIRTTFTFATPIRDLTFTVHDIDYASNQYRDWFAVVGRNGSNSYVPAMTTPFGTVNTAAGPRSSAGSSLRLGPETTPYSIDQAAAVGTGASGNNANTGNIMVRFAQPVTTIELRYGNYPYGSGESTTGQQGYGVDGISFCPMPDIAVTKTSTPYASAAGDPNRFAIPQADMVYSLTVTNSGGSPVDLGSTVLADIMPPNITFHNGDFDDGGAGTANFEFVAGSSGLTLGPADISYSNDGGATYGYAPTAGYDANVTALRFAPQGMMAANSSFTIRFRARIN